MGPHSRDSASPGASLEVMAPRSIGTGNVSFGLVSIPIKLYSTIEHSNSIRFNMLDGEDNTRVKQQYINPNTGELVPRSRMIKGYEFAKGQYVTFTDEEIKSLMEKASPAIEISEFVPLSEVEPIYYDKAYFLGPETGGERAYRLLAEAMKVTGYSALAKYAARGKQYLVMLRPYQNGLLMQQLHYADEVKAFDQVPLGEETELKEGELDLAIQLIEQIAAEDFKPEQYSDDVRERIWSTIQQRVEGQEVAEVEEEAPKAQIIDLMEALKASLGEDGEEGQPKKTAKRKPAKRSPRAKKKTTKKRKAASK
ncbi:MAG: Ku protein [Acidobacteriota bacterium]